MASALSLFSHTIGRKLVMALTGLFLIIFLVVHLAGNLQLIWGTPESFNIYTHTMTSSPLILIASYITYISILLHVIYAIVLKNINRKARPESYAYNKPTEHTRWSSRNMLFLGSIVLIFIVLHMGNFWYTYKFGDIGLADGYRDMYTVVKAAFSQWWYVAIYVLSMIGLGYHLDHGFQSAFQTLGLNHYAYNPMIKKLGKAFSVIVPAAFAAIPVYMYIDSLS